ncbi:MAG: 16S rRNA (cytidine(1402)-2'-O)-methyltransferase [Dehalobacter sp. 4CP]|nr:16S rRNA (cytidine(1402)-2'-O)-methyltransferase [Dehalobacter sp. 4CP]
MTTQTEGVLYLVGTPLGNMGDITFRAVETLKNADLIAAEDTRQTRKLLSRFEIKKPLISYHEHNKQSRESEIIRRLHEGQNIALVSDAGMPGISDPGSDLVKACIANGIEISVIPGPAALLTGLVASGIETKEFVFGGFFPRQSKDRNNLLNELAAERRTMIFYESPHRLCATLQDMLSCWGEDRLCCVARELTKVYEEYKRGTLQEVLKYYKEKGVKGEVTLIIEGYKKAEQKIELDQAVGILREKMKSGQEKKAAIKEIVVKYNLSRKELYKSIIESEKNEVL